MVLSSSHLSSLLPHGLRGAWRRDFTSYYDLIYKTGYTIILYYIILYYIILYSDYITQYVENQYIIYYEDGLGGVDAGLWIVMTR